MSTSFTPVWPKLCTHLQGFVTKITSFGVHKSTHYKHHTFLKQTNTKNVEWRGMAVSEVITPSWTYVNKCNCTNHPVRLKLSVSRESKRVQPLRGTVISFSGRYSNNSVFEGKTLKQHQRIFTQLGTFTLDIFFLGRQFLYFLPHFVWKYGKVS